MREKGTILVCELCTSVHCTVMPMLLRVFWACGTIAGAVTPNLIGEKKEKKLTGGTPPQTWLVILHTAFLLMHCSQEGV